MKEFVLHISEPDVRITLNAIEDGMVYECVVAADGTVRRFSSSDPDDMYEQVVKVLDDYDELVVIEEGSIKNMLYSSLEARKHFGYLNYIVRPNDNELAHYYSADLRQDSGGVTFHNGSVTVSIQADSTDDTLRVVKALKQAAVDCQNSRKHQSVTMTTVSPLEGHAGMTHDYKMCFFEWEPLGWRFDLHETINWVHPLTGEGLTKKTMARFVLDDFGTDWDKLNNFLNQTIVMLSDYS